MTARARPSDPIDRLWLLCASADDERAAQIQPYRQQAQNWTPDGAVWQVTWTVAGLERLRTKWQQAGRPCIAFDILGNREPIGSSELKKTATSTHAPINAAGTKQSHWVLCAPGQPFHNCGLSTPDHSAEQWTLLKKSRLPIWAACRVTSNPTTETASTHTSAQDISHPPVDDCCLVRAFLLNQQRLHLGHHAPSWRDCLPRPAAWAQALICLVFTLISTDSLRNALAAIASRGAEHRLEPESSQTTQQAARHTAELDAQQLRAACQSLLELTHEND